jgi:hypothetical protein
LSITNNFATGEYIIDYIKLIVCDFARQIMPLASRLLPTIYAPPQQLGGARFLEPQEDIQLSDKLRARKPLEQIKLFDRPDAFGSDRNDLQKIKHVPVGGALRIPEVQALPLHGGSKFLQDPLRGGSFASSGASIVQTPMSGGAMLKRPVELTDEHGNILLQTANIDRPERRKGFLVGTNVMGADQTGFSEGRQGMSRADFLSPTIGEFRPDFP